MADKRSHTEHSPQAGFTLFELLIAIIVLATIIAVAMPDLHSTVASSRVGAAARELTRAVRGAQDLAIVTAAPHAVIFDLHEGRYYVIRVTADLGIALSGSVVSDPISKKPWLFYFTEYGTALSQAINDNGRPWVLFDALGSAESHLTAVVQAGDLSRTIDVAAGTGVVTAQ